MVHKTHFVGKAGEFAVASQILLRGINVHFPACDGGVDLIAGDNIRIQVKSARKLSTGRGRAAGYHFNVSASHLDVKNRRFYGKTRDWTKVVDFFVFWGIDENIFWIAPAHMLTNAHNVCLGIQPSHFIVNQQKIVDLVRTGLDQRTVAARLGVSEMSVSRAVRGMTPTSKPSAAHEINKYEGAWDEIISAVGLVSAVNASGTATEDISKEIKSIHA